MTKERRELDSVPGVDDPDSPRVDGLAGAPLSRFSHSLFRSIPVGTVRHDSRLRLSHQHMKPL